MKVVLTEETKTLNLEKILNTYEPPYTVGGVLKIKIGSDVPGDPTYHIGWIRATIMDRMMAFYRSEENTIVKDYILCQDRMPEVKKDAWLDPIRIHLESMISHENDFWFVYLDSVEAETWKHWVDYWYKSEPKLSESVTIEFR